MSFKPGDKVFTKVKGFRHWPCRINPLPDEVKVPQGKYPIFFYGSHEVMFLSAKDIFPFEKNFERWGKKPGPPQFNLGIDEITNNPTLFQYGEDSNAEQFLAQFYDFTPSIPIDTLPPLIYDTIPPTTQTTSKPKASLKRPSRSAKPNSKRQRLEENSKLSNTGDHTPLDDTALSHDGDQPKEESLDTCDSEDLPLRLTLSHATPSGASSLKKSGECLDENQPPKDDQSLTSEDETYSPSKKPSNKQNARRKSSRNSVSRPKNSKPSIRSSKSNVPSKKELIDPTSDVSSLSSDEENPLISVKKARSTASAKTVKKEESSVQLDENNSVKSKDEDCDSESLPLGAFVKENQPVVSPQQMLEADDKADEISMSSLDDLPLKEIIRIERDDSETSEVKHTKSKKTPRSRKRQTSPEVGEKVNRRKNKNISVKEEASNLSMTIDAILPPISSDSSGEEETVQTHPQTNARKRTLFIELDEDDVPELKASNSHAGKSPQDKLRHLSTEEKISEKRHHHKNNSGSNKTKHSPNMEDRLRMINATIKHCLTKGNENFPRCLMVMKELNELPIRLSDLAKCCDLMDTLKKCRKYKGNDEIKSTAQNVYNRFLEIPADATQEEVSMASRCIQLQKSVEQQYKPPFQTNDASATSARVQLETSTPPCEEKGNVEKTSPQSFDQSKAKMDHNSPGNKKEPPLFDFLKKEPTISIDLDKPNDPEPIENTTAAEEEDERSFAELLRSIPGFELAKSTLGFGDVCEVPSKPLFPTTSDMSLNTRPLEQQKSIPVAVPFTTEWPAELVDKKERDTHRRNNKKLKRYHSSSLGNSSPESVSSTGSRSSSSSSSSSKSSVSRSSSVTNSSSHSSLATPNIEPVVLSHAPELSHHHANSVSSSFTPSQGGSIFSKSDANPGHLDLDARIQQLMQGGSGQLPTQFNAASKQRSSPYFHKTPSPSSSYASHATPNLNNRPTPINTSSIISSLPLPPGVRRDFSVVSLPSPLVHPPLSKTVNHTHSTVTNAQNSRLSSKPSVDDEDIYSLLGV